jgi:hypothetical protein
MYFARILASDDKIAERLKNIPVDEVYLINEGRSVQCNVEYVVMHTAIPSGFATAHCFTPRGQPHGLCALLWGRRRAREVVLIGIDEVVIVNGFEGTGCNGCNLILKPNS